MNEYKVYIGGYDGDIELLFRCDYDLIDAVNKMNLEHYVGLIGVKPQKGAMKWYRSSIRFEEINLIQETTEYVASGS